MKYERRTISPSEAKALLEKNIGNRPISQATVRQYLRLMAHGRFHLCPQPIVLSKGRLLDGQHRLTALALHDKPVEFVICENAPEEAMATIDRGRVRRVQDVLTVDHGLKDASRIVGLCRRIAQLNGRDPRVVKMAEFEILQIYEKYEPSITAVSDTPPGWRAGWVLGPLAWLHPTEGEKALEFRDMVVSGEGLSKAHPVLRLRDYILSNRGLGETLVETSMLKTLSSYAAFVKGEDLVKFSVSASGYSFLRARLGLPEEYDVWAESVVARYKTRKNRATRR
jgi:hypothetical protein